MARKKRLQEAAAVGSAPNTGGVNQQQTARYQDAFQQKAGKQIEEVGKKFEGKGRTLLYVLAAVAVLAVLIAIFYSWNRQTSAAAQSALGKAIELSQSPVSSAPVPAGSTERVFKSEKERAEASIAAFQEVVNKYGSPAREKAQYFIAVNRLSLDRTAGVQELENLSKNAGGEVGSMAKFALAQAKQGDGKLDEAAAIYGELAKSSDPVVSKDTINFALAGIYAKQGKKTEAADLYFQIANEASKSKDSNGKPIPLSQTAREAKDKLQEIDPARAEQIKEEIPAPELPQ